MDDKNMQGNETYQPSYYAILPASVRYDKRLKPIERILYSEITCLTKKTGYCYAHNSYFANLYECSTRAISNYLSKLQECGYIMIILEKNNDRKILLREISPIVLSSDDMNKFSNPLESSFLPPLESSFYYNNINNINSSTNIDNTNNIERYTNKDNNINNNKNKINKDSKKINYKNKTYFEDKKLNDLFIDFLDMRKQLKAVNSERAINILLKELDNYNYEKKIKVIEQSIAGSWKSLYPLKKQQQKLDPDTFSTEGKIFFN